MDKLQYKNFNVKTRIRQDEIIKSIIELFNNRKVFTQISFNKNVIFNNQSYQITVVFRTRTFMFENEYCRTVYPFEDIENIDVFALDFLL